MRPHEYWALGDERPQFGVGISISSFEHDGLGRHVYFFILLVAMINLTSAGIFFVFISLLLLLLLVLLLLVWLLISLLLAYLGLLLSYLLAYLCLFFSLASCVHVFFWRHSVFSFFSLSSFLCPYLFLASIFVLWLAVLGILSAILLHPVPFFVWVNLSSL
jgi:hypothetical protein